MLPAERRIADLQIEGGQSFLDFRNARFNPELGKSSLRLIVRVKSRLVAPRELIDQTHLTRGNSSRLGIAKSPAAIDGGAVSRERVRKTGSLQVSIAQALERSHYPLLIADALALGQRLRVIGLSVSILSHKKVDLP